MYFQVFHFFRIVIDRSAVCLPTSDSSEFSTKSLTSKTRFSQCVSAVPSSPWSSSSAPSRSRHSKCRRTSARTRGVTIICMALRTLPPCTCQLCRITVRIVLSLHWWVCVLFQTRKRRICSCLFKKTCRYDFFIFVLLVGNTIST